FGSNGQPGHVEVHGFESLAVVDANSIAKHVELFRKRDGARGDRADRFALGRTLVHAAVVFAGGLSVVKTLHAERRSHATANRRSERVPPRTRFGTRGAHTREKSHFFRGGMERFNIRREFDVLRGENGSANHDWQSL